MGAGGRAGGGGRERENEILSLLPPWGGREKETRRIMRFDSAGLPPAGLSRIAPSGRNCSGLPPWPNGQGAGLLIRRLRVRVPLEVGGMELRIKNPIEPPSHRSHCHQIGAPPWRGSSPVSPQIPPKIQTSALLHLCAGSGLKLAPGRRERPSWQAYPSRISIVMCCWILFGGHPLKLERYRED